jgi:hypothetical protein
MATRKPILVVVVLALLFGASRGAASIVVDTDRGSAWDWLVGPPTGGALALDPGLDAEGGRRHDAALAAFAACWRALAEVRPVRTPAPWRDRWRRRPRQ